MKCLSLIQPWATLVAIGVKRLETRSWRTHYRGDIAIHASKSKEHGAAVYAEPFRSVLEAAGLITESGPILPFGRIVAVGRLVDCQSTGGLFQSISDQEKAFGDYSDGRWGWQLEDVVRLPEPIPIQGRIYLWDLPAEVEAAVRKQLEVPA